MPPAALLDVPFAPVAQPHPELELVRRLGRGDARAVGEAYDAHHAAVRAMARRLTGDAAAAEDLVQDTFVALPGAARGFRGEAALRTFILSVSVNLARHHVRAAARRRAAGERLGREPLDDVPDPEQQTRRAQLAHALTVALDTLSHDHRVVFVLSEVEERPAREVAEIVGIPEATVRTRVFHARARLREALTRGGVR